MAPAGAGALSSRPMLAVVVLAVSVVLLAPPQSRAGADDPTASFAAVPLTEASFRLHKPYDLPAEARYELCDGVRRMWVYAADEPLSPGSPTRPRTELLIDKKYRSGVWQFEGTGFVPAGTTGVCIMQVFGAAKHATTLMLHVYNGALRYYDRQVIEDCIYDRWFRLNVVHDVAASSLIVFIDGVEKLRAPGRGGDLHYFKFGVYTMTNHSDYMESRWKDVRVYAKNLGG